MYKKYILPLSGSTPSSKCQVVFQIIGRDCSLSASEPGIRLFSYPIMAETCIFVLEMDLKGKSKFSEGSNVRFRLWRRRLQMRRVPHSKPVFFGKMASSN